MPRPKLRTAELRADVLREAHAALAARGVAGLTARGIAAGASTSVPAVYELFGDKAGIVRELFFDGFRRLGAALDDVTPSDDPRADLVATFAAYRGFVVREPELARLMFGRPLADLDPSEHEGTAGAHVRRTIVGRVRRAVDAGVLVGDPVDLAHVFLALAQGLALQESAGWLGGSRASIERRWRIGIDALLAGCAPEPGAPAPR